MATSEQKSNHVSKVRQAATRLLEAEAELLALRQDWDRLGLGQELQDADCQGLTVAQIAAVYTSLEALGVMMDAGHGTNFASVRVG
jgi:hypothetical protein